MRDGRYYKFWVYILTSRTGTLYVGVTKKYQVHRLVYYESYQDVLVAINREKQIKRWRREKKIWLTEKLNPRWQDLAESWGREIKFPGQPLVKTP